MEQKFFRLLFCLCLGGHGYVSFTSQPTIDLPHIPAAAAAAPNPRSKRLLRIADSLMKRSSGYAVFEGDPPC